AQKKSGGRTVQAADEYKCEIVSPILTYGDMADLQEIVRRLRHSGAFVNSQCGIHIHVDAGRYTPQTLRNLVNIIASKEDILYKALRIDPARLRWC
ncbi:amidoligase, partial [Lachnospiraceae bacterium]|nr:amidoligase [Lachnospiraceae bacterium]